MKGCDSKALEVLLLEVRGQGQVSIDDSNSDIESLVPHLELVVNLSQPIYKVCSHLLSDFSLLSDKVIWQEMFLLVLEEEGGDPGSVLCHTLHLLQVKQVAHLKLPGESLGTLPLSLLGDRADVLEFGDGEEGWSPS